MMDHVIENNFRQLKAMRDLMYSCNNEDYITDWWFYSYPDGASDEELLEIASDPEEFADIARNFICIIDDIFWGNDLYDLTYVHGLIDDDRADLTSDEEESIMEAVSGCISSDACDRLMRILSRAGS